MHSVHLLGDEMLVLTAKKKSKNFRAKRTVASMVFDSPKALNFYLIDIFDRVWENIGTVFSQRAIIQLCNLQFAGIY